MHAEALQTIKVRKCRETGIRKRGKGGEWEDGEWAEGESAERGQTWKGNWKEERRSWKREEGEKVERGIRREAIKKSRDRSN